MASVTGPANGRLTIYTTTSASPGWWGILLLVLIESTVFAGLIASYFYLFANATVWPPDGIKPPSLMVPIIYTALLLGSLIPVLIADRALANADLKGYQVWRAAGAAMLVVFLGLKYYEYSNLDYFWDDNAYGSIVWTIAGFHSAHVLIVLLKTITIQALAAKGFFNQQRRSAIQGNTLYWMFVALAWVPLFATTYLFPNFA